MRLGVALAARLQAIWWRPAPTTLAWLLAPLGALVARVAAARRVQARRTQARARVPVIVVGNVIVGGAGKTPTVIDLVMHLRAWGLRPGVVSRGHGRRDAAPRLLVATPLQPGDAATSGDEPALLHRRTGVPVSVAVGRDAALARLLEACPDVDVVVSDDGLQHHALPRNIEIVVFDGRGIGNGRVLPSGPLRERLDDLWPSTGRPQGALGFDDAGVLRYALLNGPWPAPPALPWSRRAPRPALARRALAGAVELARWSVGEAPTLEALHALRGRRVLAVAGIGEPERFFAMLADAGLDIDRLPLPDHAPFDPLPWPSTMGDVLVTEKDAVKLVGRVSSPARVWVVALDFRLPDDLLAELRDALRAAGGWPRAAVPSSDDSSK